MILEFGISNWIKSCKSHPYRYFFLLWTWNTFSFEKLRRKKMKSVIKKNQSRWPEAECENINYWRNPRIKFEKVRFADEVNANLTFTPLQYIPLFYYIHLFFFYMPPPPSYKLTPLKSTTSPHAPKSNLIAKHMEVTISKTLNIIIHSN